MQHAKRDATSPAYVIALWALLLLFCLRVIGQLIQMILPVPWLPPPSAWQGSTLPYPLLLASQLAIVSMMFFIVRRHAAGSAPPQPRLGRWLLWLGGFYFVVMAARLLIGVADWLDAAWFQRPIPAFFHLVLAAYLLLLAGFHLNWLRSD